MRRGCLLRLHFNGPRRAEAKRRLAAARALACPKCGADPPRQIVVGPAPQRGEHGIGNGLGRGLVIVLARVVQRRTLAPLPDVAVHVEEAEIVWLELGYRT